ncbi:pantoate--beta-alanine ligase [Paeniglutamicibacter cryotolerans]|nr:pantoate--beta-alanine ligase [Paeniglutamicibacter cryotolerans]
MNSAQTTWADTPEPGLPGTPATEPLLVRTVAGLKAAVAAALTAVPGRGNAPRTLALVPTMGALHEGHATLIRHAREESDVVVVTIFVNELQFNDAQDYARYPRTLDADLRLLGGVGADIVFAPEASEVYPDGVPLVALRSGPLGEAFEGAARPGHFDGMLAVVAKLLHYGQPPLSLGLPVEYRAYFGQKDAQQVVLIRRMVKDLAYEVDIRSVPIVRNAQGLALSSRNAFLTGPEAKAALVLYEALSLIRRRAEKHEQLYLEDAVALVGLQPLVRLDYFELVDPDTLAPLAFNCQDTPFTGEGLLLLAAQVGAVRLIDNVPLGT